MKKSKSLGKGLAVAIILLFIGVAFAPSVTVDADKISALKDDENVVSSQEATRLLCSFSTFKGVEKIEKEVSIEDANHLLELMDSSDIDALSSELNRLGLLPENMSIEEVKDLISGEYGRRYFGKLFEKLGNICRKDIGFKYNLLCKVNGSAKDCVVQTPLFALYYNIIWGISISLMILDRILLLCPLYPRIRIYDFISIGPLLILGVLMNECVGLGFELFMMSRLPKVLSVLYGNIGDMGAGAHESGNFKTSGPFGSWEINNLNIEFIMIGFFGLWIQYMDSVTYHACKFNGFSLYVKAKGMED